MSGLGHPTTRVEPIMDTRPEGRDFLLSPYILMTYGYRIKSIQGWDIPIIRYYPMDYRIVRKAFGQFPIRPGGNPKGRAPHSARAVLMRSYTSWKGAQDVGEGMSAIGGNRRRRH